MVGKDGMQVRGGMWGNAGFNEIYNTYVKTHCYGIGKDCMQLKTTFKKRAS